MQRIASRFDRSLLRSQESLPGSTVQHHRRRALDVGRCLVSSHVLSFPCFVQEVAAAMLCVTKGNDHTRGAAKGARAHRRKLRMLHIWRSSVIPRNATRFRFQALGKTSLEDGGSS